MYFHQGNYQCSRRPGKSCFWQGFGYIPADFARNTIEQEINHIRMLIDVRPHPIRMEVDGELILRFLLWPVLSTIAAGIGG